MAVQEISVLIKFTERRELIKKYLDILYKFHKLTDKEIEIATEIIMSYSTILKRHGKEIADKLIFDTENKKTIRNKLQISDPVFQNYLTALRKKKVIVGKTIASSYIPPLEDFNLKFMFNGQTD